MDYPENMLVVTFHGMTAVTSQNKAISEEMGGLETWPVDMEKVSLAATSHGEVGRGVWQEGLAYASC